MDAKFNEAIEVVKAANNNEFTDLCSRHLYELAANCVMSQLMLRDKSVNVESMESYRKA